MELRNPLLCHTTRTPPRKCSAYASGVFKQDTHVKTKILDHASLLWLALSPPITEYRHLVCGMFWYRVVHVLVGGLLRLGQGVVDTMILSILLWTAKIGRHCHDNGIGECHGRLSFSKFMPFLPVKSSIACDSRGC